MKHKSFPTPCYVLTPSKLKISGLLRPSLALQPNASTKRPKKMCYTPFWDVETCEFSCHGTFLRFSSHFPCSLSGLPKVSCAALGRSKPPRLILKAFADRWQGSLQVLQPRWASGKRLVSSTWDPSKSMGFVKVLRNTRQCRWFFSPLFPRI